MYQVYDYSIYNTFIKELRNKSNLTIRDLSKRLYYSVGYLSELENDPNLIKNNKLPILLEFYGLEKNYLNIFNDNINILFTKFINAVLYIDDDLIGPSFIELKDFLLPYRNTVLYSVLELCTMIYHIYWNKYEKIDSNSLNFSTNHYHSSTLILIYLYTARYYQLKYSYKNAEIFLKKANEFNIDDNNIQGMFQFLSATQYIHQTDIHQSIKHYELAVSYFSKAQNYRRLINTNITWGNQYLKMRDYPNAKKVILQTLETIRTKSFKIEKAMLLNNIAFCYMMENNFDKAAYYFSNIPTEYMKDFHIKDYLICLCETNQLTEATKLCNCGLKVASSEYIQYIFSILNIYLEKKDLKTLNRGFEKALKTYKNNISTFEIDLLHSLISYNYVKMNKYKKAVEYLEKLKTLGTN